MERFQLIKGDFFFPGRTILLRSETLLDTDLKIILLNLKINEQRCKKYWYSSN